ncbi:MAG: crossover junction endodeoxyribonuclease RuvC [Bacteroidota bacterium]
MNILEVKEKIILGIDPGTRFMGYGVIIVKANKISLVQYGVINLSKYPSGEIKLKKIFERITQIINEFTPDEVALEAPFFGKNVQSMLKLGRAQGVAMAAALALQIPIVEYSPKTVKQSVTGNGNASKEQVASMLESILKIKLDTTLYDATDAIGIAVCHHFHDNILIKTAKKVAKKATKGWGSFLSDNPERIKNQ